MFLLMPVIFQGLDLYDKIEDPKIEFDGSSISIIYDKQEFTYTEFLKDLIGNQFFENQGGDGQYGERSIIGIGVLFIMIPKDTEITGLEKYHFVN